MSNIIETVLVDSDCIYDAQYNNTNNHLTLTFKNGGIYEYRGVPSFYWHGLFNASSKGRFINKYIIRQWQYKKVA
jgi:hypothetical protein